MSFTRGYLLWLLLPPTAVTGPLSFLFLSQVIQLSMASAMEIVLLFAVFFVAAASVLWLALTPPLEAVEEAVRTRRDASAPTSECLERTTRLSLILWSAGSVLFAVLGTLFVMRSALGFSYFLLGSLIAGFPSVIWAYAIGKHRLIEYACASANLHYVGRELSLGRKIVIVFVGTFLISAAALVELISSKVSTTLERLAIASSAERFDRVFDSANLLARVDAHALDTLREYIPADYSLSLIDRDGRLTSTNESLTLEEVETIRRIGTGDSSALVSPHVFRFQQLKGGSILVMAVPWAPYKNIPLQITIYTLIIALITMSGFMGAAYVLSRDVARPARNLRGLAKEMATGNFNTVTNLFSDDELGQLAESFADTRANLRRLLGRVGGSGTTITDGVRIITGGTSSLLTHAHDQAELTENSSLALENVRAGISSVLHAADAVAGLTQDASSRALELQASAEEVARSMDYLFQSVEKTSSSTTEMNAAMAEMSQRTDVLAGIGDEVLSFVAQMDSTIMELRSGSQATADISRQVREGAAAGGEAVNRTVDGIQASHDLTTRTAEALEQLQSSVTQIGQILTVIEDITNQTNLLALNAAIIAAQAGEHGAGFTVVADEIRQLAERTRGSTKEIGEIIKAIQTGSKQAVTRIHEGVERVRDSVGLAQNAAKSLAKIMESASGSYEMATKISRALDDQAKASRHLHAVTSRMSDHISEINRATREQSRGTQLLAQEAERVRDIAAQVKKSTDEQSTAGRGITTALEKIAEDAGTMRDMLERQLRETDRIAEASRTMLDIAQENDAIAREFTATVQNLVRSGQDFETEVARFRLTT